jgi:hypothetical protein
MDTVCLTCSNFSTAANEHRDALTDIIYSVVGRMGLGFVNCVNYLVIYFSFSPPSIHFHITRNFISNQLSALERQFDLNARVTLCLRAQVALAVGVRT